jgi:hypothetical protein
MQDRGALLVGLGVGATLMYFFDPNRGARRRALVRDQLVHAGHLMRDAAGATSRDIANRASGVAARVRGAREDGPIDDRVLRERIRSQLGRIASHPRAIDVDVADGVVTLRGTILQAEVGGLCEAIRRMSGVREIVDGLDARESADNVPALQGGRDYPTIWRRQWTPTGQLITALAATAGVGLLARAAAMR